MNANRLTPFIEMSGNLNLNRQFPHLLAEGYGPKGLKCRMVMVAGDGKDLEAFQHICHSYFALIQADEYSLAIPCRIVAWPPNGAGRFKLASCATEIELLFVMTSSYSGQMGYLKLAETPEGRSWKMSAAPKDMSIEPELRDLLPHGACMTGAKLQQVQELVTLLSERLFIALSDGERSIST